MQDKSVPGILERINAKFFFGVLFFIQILFIFQGFDIADEGAHSTFYQQIYNDPESVRYSFMYWLSGIIGGAWLHLFPGAGLPGLRIAGILFNTLTAIIACNFLKKYLNEGFIKLALLFILLMNTGSVKDLNYNNISAFLAVLIVLFLFKGLNHGRLVNFLLAGFFLSLATFARLSNAAGLLMAAIIIYSGFFVIRRTIGKQFLQLFFFIGGFGITTAVVLGIMKIIGHYDIFTGYLIQLSNMARNGEINYGLLHLIKLILSEYMMAILKIMIPAGVVIIFLIGMYNRTGRKELYKKVIRIGIAVISVLLFTGFILSNSISATNYFVLLLFAGAALVATVFILFRKNNDALKILALSGMMMTWMLVLGSDVGFTGAGAGSLWIGLPIAIDFFFGISLLSASGSVEFAGKANESSAIMQAMTITEKQLRSIRRFGTCLLLLFIIVFAFGYTYNDNPDRTKMIYPLKSSYAKGLFTTRERATAINELVEQSSKYIKRNDYVLAYETMPVFYALTNTRPFIPNSWLRLYHRIDLAGELNLAVSGKKLLPVVICQKVKTNGNRIWPVTTNDNSGFDLNDPKHTPFLGFLNTYNYEIAWENVAFRIYVPEKVK